MFTITRQRPYYANMGRERTLYTVEVVYGDIDQAGPDMLPVAYRGFGEGQSYLSAVEAFEQAFKLRHIWREDMEQNDVDIEVVGGNTNDGVFELSSDTYGESDEAWMRIAKTLDEKADKCEWCDDFMGDEGYGNESTISDRNEYPFCSQNCAERAYWDGHVSCLECQADIARKDIDPESWLCPSCLEKKEEEDVTTK